MEITITLLVTRRGIIATIKTLIIIVLIFSFVSFNMFSSLLQFFLSFVLSLMHLETRSRYGEIFKHVLGHSNETCFGHEQTDTSFSMHPTFLFESMTRKSLQGTPMGYPGLPSAMDLQQPPRTPKGPWMTKDRFEMAEINQCSFWLQFIGSSVAKCLAREI